MQPGVGHVGEHGASHGVVDPEAGVNLRDNLSSDQDLKFVLFLLCSEFCWTILHDSTACRTRNLPGSIL